MSKLESTELIPSFSEMELFVATCCLSLEAHDMIERPSVLFGVLVLALHIMRHDGNQFSSFIYRYYDPRKFNKFDRLPFNAGTWGA